MGRWDIARRIAALDAERDHVEIYRLSTGFEFPWDYRRALELALLRTFAVPSIADLLVATGEFERFAQRRYDDTAILMGELAAHGYDSERGRTALRRINRAHGHYRIHNDDMLYVLSTFVLDPVRWIDRYGWRRLRPTADSRALGRQVLGLMASWFPGPVQGPAATLVPAVFDDQLRYGLGLDVVPRWQRRAAHTALRARAAVVRRMPPRRDPAFDDGAVRFRGYPGYPEGYDLGAIGAPDPPAGIDGQHLARDVRGSGS